MSIRLSFDDTQTEILITPNGTPAVAFDQYPWGSGGRILKIATLAGMETEGWDISEVLEEGYSRDTRLYLFEFKNGRPNEYIWRENLYPIPLEQL